MAVVDEIAAEINKVPPKKVAFDDEPLSLNGPVKTPAAGEYPVPQDSDFGSADFLFENDLAAMGGDLINGKASLAHLKGFEIHYRWKRKGGEASGRKTFGKLTKPSGMLRDYSGADFIVWLAADHCQGMSKHEVEAALFAQLCYAGKDDEGNRTITPPDLHTHIAVIREYGLVNSELRAAAKAMKQLSLPDL